MVLLVFLSMVFIICAVFEAAAVIFDLWLGCLGSTVTALIIFGVAILYGLALIF